MYVKVVVSITTHKLNAKSFAGKPKYTYPGDGLPRSVSSAADLWCQDAILRRDRALEAID